MVTEDMVYGVANRSDWGDNDILFWMAIVATHWYNLRIAQKDRAKIGRSPEEDQRTAFIAERMLYALGREHDFRVNACLLDEVSKAELEWLTSFARQFLVVPPQQQSQTAS